MPRSYMPMYNYCKKSYGNMYIYVNTIYIYYIYIYTYILHDLEYSSQGHIRQCIIIVKNHMGTCICEYYIYIHIHFT